ncbi:hypothetical protein PGT21_026628 [Puccinia graminis f. sp. tritici]|uniref:Uncharacterized protein n=1 Tax=Puccinia graminis f. sp. tritici TaxID=56615 RepID=A0A5B0QUQ4_PUCGR|nr:hypothetical protein PGT21_026628 [Puccinia graminis f. sp. tritici]KAA1117021.1 hypothetical protein PGTUg99_034183 [Puccinia graminis f. sp. tritici]
MYLPPPVPLPPPDPPPAPPPAPLHPSDGRHGSLAPAGLLEAGGTQLGAHAWRPPGTIRDAATVTSRRASENPIRRNWRMLNGLLDKVLVETVDSGMWKWVKGSLRCCLLKHGSRRKRRSRVYAD